MDVTILDHLYKAQMSFYVNHAPQLNPKVLHPSTFEKMDTKKAEPVR